MDAPTDKDLPLKEDTRLLGRVLGDVLRAQTGEEGFARIEAIRQAARHLRRASPGDAPAGEWPSAGPPRYARNLPRRSEREARRREPGHSPARQRRPARRGA